MSLEEKFAPELLRDEKLLWTGQPGRRFDLADGLSVFVGLIFTAYGAVMAALPLISHSSKKGEPPLAFFLTVGSVLLLIGVAFPVSHFFNKARRLRSTFYGVTNLRVLVVLELRQATLQAAFIRQLPVIVRSMRRNGTGTVRFGMGGRMWPASQPDIGPFAHALVAADPPMFLEIRDAEQVYKLVSEQQHTALERG